MPEEKPEKPEYCDFCGYEGAELGFVASPVGIKDREGWFCIFCRKTYAIRAYQYPDRYDAPLYLTLVRLAWGVADLLHDDLEGR